MPTLSDKHGETMQRVFYSAFDGGLNLSVPNESLAKNYREAAMIMRSYGNYSKAQTLLNKAYSFAKNTENMELRMLILQDMESV